jgi:hypothetical protein
MRTSGHLIVTHIVRSSLESWLTFNILSVFIRQWEIQIHCVKFSAGTTFHRRTSLLPAFPLGARKTVGQTVLSSHSAHGSTSRPASYSTGTRVVSRGSSRRGVKLTTHLHPVPSLRMTGCPPLPPYALMAWRGTTLSLKQVAGPRCWHVAARTHMKCGKGKGKSKGNVTPRMLWRHTRKWSYRPIHFKLRYSMCWVVGFTFWPL